MTVELDKKALTRWKKSAISYKNYHDFINKKSERFKLSLIDLLYISNFKGGNATINESQMSIDIKLASYTKELIAINEKFKYKTLAELTDNEIRDLIISISSICDLTHKSNLTKIDGFRVSYLSALLSSYFPTLIPILDRRVLINLNIVSTSDIYKNGQIKNIQKYYGLLVKKIAELCKREHKSVREIDKYLFTIKLKHKVLG